jgi:SPP1 gp7 family putative phage head morphogenesis protein
MWGAHEADGRIAAKNAVKIRAALRQSVDATQVYEQYQTTQPAVSDNATQDRARARAWALMNIRVNNESLRAALLRLYAEAWVTGEAAANEAIGEEEELAKAPKASIDWSKWNPGDAASALLLDPPKAFQDLVESTGSLIRGLDRTGYELIGTALADSIRSGYSPKRAAKLIQDAVGSPARALTIAVTESSRVMNNAALGRYKDAGLTQVKWSTVLGGGTSVACEKCAQNDGQVVQIGSSFNSGNTQPPAHPHCRCNLRPVVPDYNDVSNTTGSIDISPTPNRVGLRPSTLVDTQFDNEFAEIRQYLPANESMEDVIRGLKGHDEYNYDKLHRALVKKYTEQGMGATNAKTQASAKIGRLAFYFDNKADKDKWAKYVESLIADGYPKDAANLKHGLKVATETVKDAMRNGKVTIAVTESNFAQIIDDGRFKNQFETKTSGGMLSTSTRKIGEGMAQGIPADAATKSRPIYGFITTHEAPTMSWKKYQKTPELSWDELTNINSGRVEQYGEIRVVLKDTVRENTTLTIGDSLRTGNLAENLLAEKPNLTQMGLYDQGAPIHMNGTPTAQYLEAQITGGVTVNDIEVVYAPPELVANVTMYLKDKNIDVPVKALSGIDKDE